MDGQLPRTRRVRLWTAPIYDIYTLFGENDAKDFLRHLRKLESWPGIGLNGDPFLVQDLFCYPIKALHHEAVWDVRLNGPVGAKDHVRVIVWVEKARSSTPPFLWVLQVVQKQEEEFSQEEIMEFMKRKEDVIKTYKSDS